ncbi:MAG: LiaF transmembrane domain-containing protein [Chloroflexota bacterium]
MTSDHSDDPTGQVPIQPAPEPRQSTEPPAAPPRPAPSPGPAPRPPDADRGRNASLILGLVFLVIGGWFFATTTLGLDLPDLDWGQFWPVILIILGLAIVLRSLDRRRS